MRGSASLAANPFLPARLLTGKGEAALLTIAARAMNQQTKPRNAGSVNRPTVVFATMALRRLFTATTAKHA
jgi:hypothetical protein